jgi:transcriptional regulator with XRE-family HTH domain
MTNAKSSAFVRTSRNDYAGRFLHNANMARRGIPKGKVNWFLREWMDSLGVRQAEMMRRTEWSKATASQLYTGKQDYSPKIVNEAAAALHLEPFELLLPPERAMAIRRLRESAAEIVSSEPPPMLEDRPAAA